VIAKQLMRSHSFIVSAIYHVLPGWHRKRPYHEVLKYANEVTQMVRRGATAVEFYRVFIPKPGKDAVRPLGVPTIPWRIYLHMWNVLLTWLMNPIISGSQHAYQPGKGVITA